MNSVPAPGGFKLALVDAIGERDAQVLVGGRIITIKEPIYPDGGETLRFYRVHDGEFLNLREAALALGMKASEFSALETGAATIESEDEWRRLFALLGRAKAQKKQP